MKAFLLVGGALSSEVLCAFVLCDLGRPSMLQPCNRSTCGIPRRRVQKRKMKAVLIVGDVSSSDIMCALDF